MQRRYWWGVAVAVALCAAAALVYFKSLDPYRPQTIARDMRCPVCGMYPSLSPKWMAQIVFTDRGMVAFDSPLELLRYVHDWPRYGNGRQAADVARIYVSDFINGSWLRAEHAYFVAGARVRGPMRDENFPAFASQSAADLFAKQEGGRVLGYAELAATPPPAHPLPHTHQ